MKSAFHKLLVFASVALLAAAFAVPAFGWGNSGGPGDPGNSGGHNNGGD